MKFVFLGPPGAGKGTLAGEISEKYGIIQISTGDIFRAAIKNKTPLGLKVKECIETGGLVSDDLTIELVRERLKQDDVQKSFILDGFPRTTPQAQALEKITPLTAVIDFSIADDAVIKRLSGRRMCSGCGKVYHIETRKPQKDGVCDECGKQLIVRKDDAPDIVASRLETYRAQTADLIHFYGDQDLLFTIDAGKPIRESLEQFAEKFLS